MSRANWRDDRGQTLVIVALMLTALFGFVGLVADIGWYELNMVRVQRAADAAALAGVVYLPGNVGGAATAAQNEAAKNGFATGVNGVTVTAAPDPLNGAILNVTVSGPVRTFFARLFRSEELNMVRVQRAADAAALAGVVYLPGNVGGAATAAQNEAAKNGFATGVNGVTVTAAPDPLNGAILNVTVSGPVRTFFARLF